MTISVEVIFPVGVGNFSGHQNVQTDSGAHPASYTMGTGGFFLGGKVKLKPHTPNSEEKHVLQLTKMYICDYSNLNIV
jgi:hypothetical protein